MSSNESKQDSHKPPEQIQGHFSLRRSVWGSWRLREYSLDRRSRCHGAARISAMRVASTRRKSADGMLVDLGARIGQTRIIVAPPARKSRALSLLKPDRRMLL